MTIDVDKIVQMSNYGKSGKNMNTLRIEIGKLSLWFSYETVVAYSDCKDGLVICKNQWSNTTGKHLNLINDDKSRRIDRKEFKEKLQEALIRNGIINAKEEITKVLEEK